MMVRQLPSLPCFCTLDSVRLPERLPAGRARSTGRREGREKPCLLGPYWPCSIVATRMPLRASGLASGHTCGHLPCCVCYGAACKVLLTSRMC